MDQSIEEYKTLRTEILRNFEAIERNLIACITANGVAIAYGIKESQPLVLVLAILIPIYFWIQHILYRDNIAKIASYIVNFLEGHETNLMWETRVGRIDLEKTKKRIPYFMRTFLNPYIIILIVSILLMIWMLKPAYALLISFIITLIILVIAKYTDIPYSKLRISWIDDWKNIKAKEQEISIVDQRNDRT